MRGGPGFAVGVGQMAMPAGVRVVGPGWAEQAHKDEQAQAQAMGAREVHGQKGVWREKERTAHARVGTVEDAEQEVLR